MALFAAVKDGDRWRVNFLLNRGVRINAKDPDGEGVLVAALAIENPQKRHKMFRWLLSKGADALAVSRTSGRDALIWASRLDRPAEVDVVLTEVGAELDLRRRDFAGYTALHYAVVNDARRTVENLCRFMRHYDVAVDAPDADGTSPYLLALRLGRDACARILRDVGAACRHAGDDRTGQSEHFWRALGGWERALIREAERRRTVGVYKRLGRLPQLIDAGYDVDRIRIVPSLTERRVVLAETGGGGGRRLPDPLDLAASFDPDGCGPVVGSKVDAGGGGKPKQRPLEEIVADVYRSMETDSFFAHERRHQRRSRSPDELAYTPRMLRHILDIASEQSTGAFVPPAKAPKRGTFVGAANATTFGVKTKRRANRNHKNAAARATIDGAAGAGHYCAASKDRLPVLAPS